MCNDDACRLEALQAAADNILSPVIQSTRGLVKKQDTGFVDDRPGDEESLPLSAREVAPILAHHCVHSHGHKLYVIIQTSHAGGLPGVIHSHVRGCPNNVGEDVARHNLCALKHDANLLADSAQVQSAKILAIVKNTTRFRGFKTHQQTQERGFSRTRRTDKSYEFTRLDSDRDVL